MILGLAKHQLGSNKRYLDPDNLHGHGLAEEGTFDAQNAPNSIGKQRRALKWIMDSAHGISLRLLLRWAGKLTQ